jgi:prophage regulatory protein
MSLDLGLRQSSIQPMLVPSPHLVSGVDYGSTAEKRSEAAEYDLDDTIFLRLSRVKEITGLSKSCLYLLIREKSFPAPVRIGNRAVAWVRSEIRQWALERIGAPR